MGVYNPKKKMPTSCYMCWDSLYCEYKIKNPVKMAQGRADDCPLIDIITCKDCNRSGTDGENTFCMWLGALRKPTDFCSYGERRTDESKYL